MDIEVFKRNLQLYKLGIAELDGDERRAYDFLINNLSALNTYKFDKYPDLIFFSKVGIILLVYHLEEKCLEINYHRVWSFFRENLSMVNIEIDSLILWWVQVTLDLTPTHTIYLKYDYNHLIPGNCS